MIAITSDNGQNIYNAVKDQLKIPFPVGCFSHTVYLAVDKAMDGCFISLLMAKAKRIVEHFKKSGKSTTLLRKAQIALGRKESEVLELFQSCETRCTSAHAMLERLVLLSHAVHKVLSESDKKELR